MILLAAVLCGIGGAAAFAQAPPSGEIDLTGVDQVLPPETAPVSTPLEEPAPAPAPLPTPTPTPVEPVPPAPRSELTTAESPATPSAPAASGSTLWELVKAGGWIGGILFLLSLAACSLAIQLSMTIRRKTLLPPALAEEVGGALERGRLAAAMDRCGRDRSFLAQVLLGGLKNFDGGWDDVEEGASEALASETARLYRRTEFLSVIGNIAPMLGLLGTVLGMVAAFGELASSDGLGRFANLAQGIYFALVTTVDGLLVAIPSLCVYSFFNHRVATLSAETAALTEELLRPLRRHFLSQRAAGSSGGSSINPPAAPPSAPPAAAPRPMPSLKTHRRAGEDDSE